jgi:hypothetical protein
MPKIDAAHRILDQVRVLRQMMGQPIVQSGATQRAR